MASDIADPASQLAERLPGLRIETRDLDLYSTDVFYQAPHAPVAVLHPESEGDIVNMVREAAVLGLGLYARGGGLSYSAGYLPVRPNCALVDLSALDKVIEINAEDRYVTVEAGVTWAQLRDALRPLGLMTPFWGTFSGLHATVGGSVSQGAKFFGSASRGSSAESVLGLRVVTGTGEVIETGSAGGENTTPFFRNYGPDLTGIFLGDCGAFGIKTQITLQLIPTAKGEAFVSFSFDDPAAQMRAMGQIGAELLASECLGMDPFSAQSRMQSDGLLADLKTVGQIIKGASSLRSGLRDATLIALHGRRFAKKVGYLMNTIIEGGDQREADRKAQRVRAIARNFGGREIPASIPRVMRAMPFPPMSGLLTPSGKRMAWLHTVVPNSRGAECFTRTEAVFQRDAVALKAAGISHGYLLSTHGPSGVGVETLIRWSDAPLPIHLDFMSEAQRAALKRRPDNPASREKLRELTRDILAEWRELGGVHMQVGRKYPFMQTRQAPVRALLDQLKHQFDPSDIMSPGNLFTLD
ncbi:D-lactate dehydrogenase (cytochrome) [Devosia lucknowensis]|uniref:D-lactate dehydrogenase (cytochrome) n=1 Tax=Devosia lucknowensis TaxID=1096929 RepID=A0A1Y6GD24_9HYPH|nr:FAD-binding oxidoreductase [Devosia lucknowensis]SMQ85700.1 D-lactate dehydrogenase (cytochrome) [Devosia lucknowensis]